MTTQTTGGVVQDRHRADALLAFIGELVEDYGNG